MKDGLTKQQLRCVKLYVLGKPYKAIAAELGLAIQTVDYHIGEARKRLRLKQRINLFRWAFEAGF